MRTFETETEWGIFDTVHFPWWRFMGRNPVNRNLTSCIFVDGIAYEVDRFWVRSLVGWLRMFLPNQRCFDVLSLIFRFEEKTSPKKKLCSVQESNLQTQQNLAFNMAHRRTQS